MSPKLSIVIPTYNMEKWLPVAVESCLAQTEPDIEVIIVNDGSSDASPQIADAYAASDDRVRVVHQENKGLGGARQAGQDAAQGEFITWLDADDFLHEKAAEDMLGVAYRDNVKMVCGNAVVFSDKTFNTRRYFYKEPV
ncbi:glycosyltransferase family 2 protein, partial [Desulfobaculum sp.]